MLRLTYIPAGGLTADGLLLCNSSRSITELNVAFNHRRMISVENLCTIADQVTAAYAQDFSNHRNTLSLRVRRNLDFGNAAFATPEDAFLFTLDQPQKFTGIGTLVIELGPAAAVTATRYLLNCGVEQINNKYEDLGVSPAYDYTFNGGLITADNPLGAP